MTEFVDLSEEESSEEGEAAGAEGEGQERGERVGRKRVRGRQRYTGDQQSARRRGEGTG